MPSSPLVRPCTDYLPRIKKTHKKRVIYYILNNLDRKFKRQYAQLHENSFIHYFTNKKTTKVNVMLTLVVFVSPHKRGPILHRWKFHFISLVFSPNQLRISQFLDLLTDVSLMRQLRLPELLQCVHRLMLRLLRERYGVQMLR